MALSDIAQLGTQYAEAKAARQEQVHDHINRLKVATINFGNDLAVEVDLMGVPGHKLSWHNMDLWVKNSSTEIRAVKSSYVQEMLDTRATLIAAIEVEALNLVDSVMT